MESKIRAATMASQRGVDVVIASGFEKHVVNRIFTGEVIGTVFTEKWEMQALTPRQVCVKAKTMAKTLAGLDGDMRTALLRRVAAAVVAKVDDIVRENEADVSAFSAPPVTAEQILGLANSFEVLAKMQDPIGTSVTKRSITNGLVMERVTTPLGVVLVLGDVVEVFLQAIALCLRTGNSLIFYDCMSKRGLGKWLCEVKGPGKMF